MVKNNNNEEEKEPSKDPSSSSSSSSMFDMIVGNDFASERAALEECGGDPSFLDDYNAEDEEYAADNKDDKDEKWRAEILELGGDLSFLEDANNDDSMPMNIPFEKMEFLDATPKKASDLNQRKARQSMDNSGLVAEAQQAANIPSTSSSFLSNFAQLDSFSNPMQGGLHTRGQEEEDYEQDDDNDDDLTADGLERMGGDPSFLESNVEIQSDMMDEIYEMGGDPSFLDGFVESEQRRDAYNKFQKDNTQEGIYSSDKEESPTTTTIDQLTSEGPFYTAMEGETFNSQIDELEALGGDPFFLDGEDIINDEQVEDAETTSEELSDSDSSLAPDPSFLLNYVQKKDAAFSETNNESDNSDVNLADSNNDGTFLASGERAEDEVTYPFDLADEIEEMGGDPSFL